MRPDGRAAPGAGRDPPASLVATSTNESAHSHQQHGPPTAGSGADQRDACPSLGLVGAHVQQTVSDPPAIPMPHISMYRTPSGVSVQHNSHHG